MFVISCRHNQAQHATAKLVNPPHWTSLLSSLHTTTSYSKPHTMNTAVLRVMTINNVQHHSYHYSKWRCEPGLIAHGYCNPPVYDSLEIFSKFIFMSLIPKATNLNPVHVYSFLTITIQTPFPWFQSLRWIIVPHTKVTIHLLHQLCEPKATHNI